VGRRMGDVYISECNDTTLPHLLDIKFFLVGWLVGVCDPNGNQLIACAVFTHK